MSLRHEALQGGGQLGESVSAAAAGGRIRSPRIVAIAEGYATQRIGQHALRLEGGPDPVFRQLRGDVHSGHRITGPLDLLDMDALWRVAAGEGRFEIGARYR